MRFRPVFSAALAAFGLVFSGCGGGDEAAPSSSSSKGASASKDVVVDGSSTVFRISNAAAEGFKAAMPDVVVVVNNHGTGGGFGKYIQGEVDIVDASRPAKPDEEKKAVDGGMPWTRFLVGYDGITVVVNAKNDFVASLTVADLKRLFEPESKIHTWKDLNPAWPDRKVTIYTPDKDSGTFEFFTEAIVGKAKSQRKDVQASSDDNVLVTGVGGDTDAIGYFGYAYYAANKAKLKAIPVQSTAEAKPVTPRPESILDKTYTPLSRPLFIYVKNSAMARAEVKAFVKYYLDNIDVLTKTAGYVAPTADDKAANTKSFSGESSTASK